MGRAPAGQAAHADDEGRHAKAGEGGLLPRLRRGRRAARRARTSPASSRGRSRSSRASNSRSSTHAWRRSSARRSAASWASSSRRERASVEAEHAERLQPLDRLRVELRADFPLERGLPDPIPRPFEPRGERRRPSREDVREHSEVDGPHDPHGTRASARANRADTDTILPGLGSPRAGLRASPRPRRGVPPRALEHPDRAGASDPEAATAVALVVAAIVFAPVAVLTWDVDADAWPYIVASATLELAYFVLLAAAYRRSRSSGSSIPSPAGSRPCSCSSRRHVVLGAAPPSRRPSASSAVTVGVFLVRGSRGDADRARHACSPPSIAAASPRTRSWTRKG